MKNKLQTLGLCTILGVSNLAQANEEAIPVYSFKVDKLTSIVYSKEDEIFCVKELSKKTPKGTFSLFDENCDGVVDKYSENNNIRKEFPHSQEYSFQDELYYLIQSHYSENKTELGIEDSISSIHSRIKDL